MLRSDSCLTISILNAFPRSCLLPGREQMTVSSVWSEAVNAMQSFNAARLSLRRMHFEKLKQIPVLQLDASVEFKSDPEVRQQFITEVRSFTAL